MDKRENIGQGRVLFPHRGFCTCLNIVHKYGAEENTTYINLNTYTGSHNIHSFYMT